MISITDRETLLELVLVPELGSGDGSTDGRIEVEGKLLEIIDDDCRNIRGRFDVFLSVGMLEHVGLSLFGDLGEVVDRCLSESGRGLLRFIGRNRSGDISLWTRTRICPGTCAPRLRQAMEIFEDRDFSVLDGENPRLHCARTVERWLERFEKASDRVAALFGAELVRVWRLYLTASIATFRTASMPLFQIAFARGKDNGIPWTRAHVYGAPATGREERWIASTS